MNKDGLILFSPCVFRLFLNNESILECVFTYMCISVGFVKNPSVKYYSTNGVLRFLVSSIIPFSQMRILFRDTRKYTQTVQDNSKMLSKGSVWNYLTYHNYAIFNYLCTGDNQILLSRLIHIAEWT